MSGSIDLFELLAILLGFIFGMMFCALFCSENQPADTPSSSGDCQDFY